MIKKHLKTIIITSVITLAPMIVGIFLWDKLPDTIATHFGIGNEADGWAGKGFAVVGIPLLMFALQWVCVFATLMDPKKKNISEKMFGLILWLMPLISCTSMSFIYMRALETDINASVIAAVIMGVIFVLIGNYMPKCGQSYTVGYKLPWTLADEGNWNATHRFAGWVMMIGGIVMLVSSPFSMLWMSISIMLVIALSPAVFSFVYYIRHK